MTDKYTSQMIKAETGHFGERNSTTKYINVFLRKCDICWRTKFYTKKMAYCIVCKRYAHKKCVKIINEYKAALDVRGQRKDAYDKRIESNKGLDMKVADENDLLSLEIVRLTEENSHMKQRIKILEDTIIEDNNILLRQIDELESAVARLELDKHKCKLPGPVCGIFSNEHKTLEMEFEKIKIPNTTTIEKNEFRHKNVHTKLKLDEQAYINTQIAVQQKQGLRKCLEVLVDNLGFWTDAIGRVKPVVIANVRARTVRDVTATLDYEARGEGATETWTNRGNRCTVVAVIERRLPRDDAEETSLIFVDRSGYEWTVTHRKALEIVGIPSRYLRFLSRLMEETVRDSKNCNGTTVIRNAEKTPVEFTVMMAETRYTSPGDAFFRIRLDASETSLDRTVRGYFVMAYERRRETLRVELFDLPEMSDIFGAYR